MEELERIESCDLDSLIPSASARDTKEVIPTACKRLTSQVIRMRDQLCARSDVADGVCRILDLLHDCGVLIMDEVDVILNPLRSELNFPIGAPALMAGYRWDLPIYLIDAVFFLQYQRLCEPLFSCPADDSISPNEVKHCSYKLLPKRFLNAIVFAGQPSLKQILHRLCATLRRGYEQCALQREPHLVLLSER